MSAPPRSETWQQRLLLAIFLIGVTAAVHYAVAGFHFMDDDYIVLRPWSRAELISTITGTWDPYLYEELYHRPLESFLQAAQFAVFGLNAQALHMVSLMMVAGIAWMIAVFVTRETGSFAAGVAGAVLFVVHPVLPDSASAWIFNQMHLTALTLAMAALLLWQRRRDGPALGWWPIFALLVPAFYLKEDGIMVLPALVVSQMLCARMTRQVRMPPTSVVVAVVALAIVLGAIRLTVFPYFIANAPGWSLLNQARQTGLSGLASGPWHTLLRLGGTSALAYAASAVLAGIFLTGLAAGCFKPRESRWSLWIIGATLMLFVNLPHILVARWTRDHLVLLAAVLLLSAAVNTIRRMVPAPARPWAAGLLAVGLLPLAALSREHSLAYAPCGAEMLERAVELRPEPALSSDLADYLSELPAACAAGAAMPPVQARQSLMWRVGPWLSDPASNLPYRWVETHSVVLVREDARQVTVLMRHPEASPAHEIAIRLHGAGTPATMVRLTSPEWSEVVVPLKRTWRSRLRDSFRIDVETTTGPGVAARGVQMQALRIR